MLAANHISWLDVYALIAVCPARFVAKAEIRSWPLLGWLSRNAGTLFIERTKRSDTARINEHIGNALTTGDRVAIFPEGTTSDGTILRHFHASLLQPAMTVAATLYPVAISYTDTAGKTSKNAPYAGISMLKSVLQILTEPWIGANWRARPSMLLPLPCPFPCRTRHLENLPIIEANSCKTSAP
jgi:1-acyl-sn-glycerol-3-phosphate acyltransferase